MSRRSLLTTLAVAAATILVGAALGVVLPRRDATSAPAPTAGIQYPQRLQQLSPPPTRLAVEGDDVYFAGIQTDGNNHLYRYRPASDDLARWTLPTDAGGGWFLGIASDGAGSVWVSWDRTLVRVNTSTQRVDRFMLPPSAFAVPGVDGDWVRDLAVADGRVWITRNHAAALLRFDPATSTFTEVALPSFGVPDRLRVSGSQLWVTQARDALNQSFGAVVVVDIRSGVSSIVPERASAVTVDGSGRAVLAGAGATPRAVDAVTRRVTQSYSSPFVSTASDILDIASDGTIVLANRVSGQLAVLDPGAQSWKTFKPTTEFVQPIGIPGGSGPQLREINPEFTDVRFARDGTAWVANPSYGRILRLIVR